MKEIVSVDRKFIDDPVDPARIERRELPGIRKEHHSSYALCLGPDDRIYLSACVEGGDGDSALLYAYDIKKDKMELICDVADVTGDRPDSGRIPQSKIHAALCPSKDGKVYAATHTSAAPKGKRYSPPLKHFRDAKIGYQGGHIFSYDTGTGELEDLAMVPWDSLPAMALDEKSRRLYCTSHMRGHLYRFDIDDRRLLDLGRVADVQSIVKLCINSRGEVFGTDLCGELWRYDADRGLVNLSARAPGIAGRIGWFNSASWFASGPDNRYYGITYYDGRVFALDVESDPPCFEDLGPSFSESNPGEWVQPSGWAATFDRHGRLYYGVTIYGLWRGAQLVSFDINTREITDHGVVDVGGHKSHLLVEGICGPDGRLYFGDAVADNSGPNLIIYTPPDSEGNGK